MASKREMDSERESTESVIEFGSKLFSLMMESRMHDGKNKKRTCDKTIFNSSLSHSSVLAEPAKKKNYFDICSSLWAFSVHCLRVHFHQYLTILVLFRNERKRAAAVTLDEEEKKVNLCRKPAVNI